MAINLDLGGHKGLDKWFKHRFDRRLEELANKVTKYSLLACATVVSRVIAHHRAANSYYVRVLCFAV